MRNRYYTHEETVNNIVAAVAKIYCKCILNNFVRREGNRNRVRKYVVDKALGRMSE